MIPSIDIAQIIQVAGHVLVMACLICASKQDIKTRKVSNIIPVTIVLIFALTCVATWFLSRKSISTTDIFSQVAFAVGMLIVLLVVTVGIEKIMGKDMFGGGDIKLVCAACLFLNIETLPIAVLTTSILELCYALFKRAKGQQFSEITYPFAPFWTIGIFVAFAFKLLV